MDSCDALVVGGGPAGSTCAWKLCRAGFDVVVVDRAVFPRPKVCGGWITPQVVAELGIDIEEYRRGRTWQPMTGFRVGLIGGNQDIETLYDRPVSFGIRRCEFDHFLLERSSARVMQMKIVDIAQDGDDWVVNDAIRTPMLVGAGGQFCPVARRVNGPTNLAPLVVAQEAEFPVDAGFVSSVAVKPDVPELYFSRDLRGYGWCFRKQGFLNVGLGRIDRRSLPRATAEFVEFLASKRRLVSHQALPWHGHAYALYGSARRTLDRGVLLVGDAAGLAYPQSGEGIRPAIESGLLAAATIIEAGGNYARERLTPYEDRLRARLGSGAIHRALARVVSTAPGTALARSAFRTPAFLRHVVLDRWFLHADQPALASEC